MLPSGERPPFGTRVEPRSLGRVFLKAALCLCAPGEVKAVGLCRVPCLGLCVLSCKSRQLHLGPVRSALGIKLDHRAQRPYPERRVWKSKVAGGRCQARGGGPGPGGWGGRGLSRSGKAAGLAPRGCCNVLARAQRLKTARIYQLAVLQAGSLMRAPLRYDQVAAGPVPSVNPRGEFFPAFSSS